MAGSVAWLELNYRFSG